MFFDQSRRGVGETDILSTTAHIHPKWPDALTASSRILAFGIQLQSI